MGDHIYNFDELDHHGQKLVIEIINEFTKIRIHHECKLNAEANMKPRIRTKFNRLVLFKHQ